VRAPNSAQSIEFAGWTLRLRAGQAHPGRLLLLLHGWTGDENSMWVFARQLPSDYWILAPRAPHPTKPSGYSWRVGPPSRGSSPGVEDLRPALQGLLLLLDRFAAEHQLPLAAWNMMGFSQGAVMAATIALLFPERVNRLAMLAGFLPRGAEDLTASQPLRGKHVFVSHGSLDETVDIELARKAVRLLEAAGASVELCEDEVGHKVSANCMRRLGGFFL
jgi:phospholipase/carboxylesterase